jgi:hypothetical protein
MAAKIPTGMWTELKQAGHIPAGVSPPGDERAAAAKL